MRRRMQLLVGNSATVKGWLLTPGNRIERARVCRELARHPSPYRARQRRAGLGMVS
jgi:hypothetical protein